MLHTPIENNIIANSVNSMNYLEIALKIIVALSIINVWLLRFGKINPVSGWQCQKYERRVC
jgi:hypothetical protein